MNYNAITIIANNKYFGLGNFNIFETSEYENDCINWFVQKTSLDYILTKV